MHFSVQAWPAAFHGAFKSVLISPCTLFVILICLSPNIICSWYYWVILVLVKAVLFCALYVVNLIRHLRYEYVNCKFFVFLYNATFIYCIRFPPPAFSFSFWCVLQWTVTVYAVYLSLFQKQFIIVALIILGDYRSFFSVSNNSLAGLNYS